MTHTDYFYTFLENFFQDAVAHFTEECEIIEDLSDESQKESAKDKLYQHIEQHLLSYAQEYADSNVMEIDEDDIADSVARYGIHDLIMIAHRNNMLNLDARRIDNYTFNTMLLGLAIWTETDINDLVKGVIENAIQTHFYKAE